MKIIVAFVGFMIILGFLRRFRSRNKGKGRVVEKDLHSYLRRHEKEAEDVIRAMRDETAQFDAGEALAPVEAGLRELLDLHGRPEGLKLDREGDTLVLCSTREPLGRVSVYWSRRAATISRNGKSRHLFGNGHWEITEPDGMPEPYMDLAPLMGRLSALLRAMIGQETAGTAEGDVSGGQRSSHPTPETAAVGESSSVTDGGSIDKDSPQTSSMGEVA